MTTPTTEATCNAWYCGRCRAAYKVEPELFTPACKCPRPIYTLRPTHITQMTAVPSRLRPVTDEDARLRSLARRGRRVRVTLEAEVTEVSRCYSEGREADATLTFIVTTADGRRHAIEPAVPGVHIAALGYERTAR
ncbi:hypothetical protein [Streptomyces reniochalinae]|uniref:Uncharacterized protein n=1 Tax=Streptomyces reniochalinae TaxID=2250578 RepID=A0A367EW38_9ACTN|nr:hypothetical protein [Streptomyces reniochalinae]RCG21795.1 hypothetical protein DQ392_08795 [Streptomyces reniochalinae]